jgi:hypothetical protein
MKPQIDIAAAHQLLIELTRGEHTDDEARANQFMRHLFNIGRAIELDPRVAASIPVRLFFEATPSRLFRLVLALGLFVTRTTYLLASNWEDDEWRYVCERRSSIEFLRTIFDVSEMEELIDTGEVDELINERGKEEGPVKSVPEGIPDSHWWWWYPNQPPSSVL